MGTREDRWFEVWYSPGGDLRPQYDLLPTWLLVTVPDVEHPGHVLVFDPFNNNEIVFHGASYEEVINWLGEDEYELAQGRMFPDEGFRFIPQVLNSEKDRLPIRGNWFSLPFSFTPWL